MHLQNTICSVIKIGITLYIVGVVNSQEDDNYDKGSKKRWNKG